MFVEGIGSSIYFLLVPLTVVKPIFHIILCDSLCINLFYIVPML